MAGYNTVIEHHGETFHVQTEDKGLAANYVESAIYKSGRVLSARKAFYTQFLNSSDLREKINQIIDEQHKAILREIYEGAFDHL